MLRRELNDLGDLPVGVVIGEQRLAQILGSPARADFARPTYADQY
jgi:hypothetical protein